MNIESMIKENPILAIFRNVSSDILLDYTQSVINGGIRFLEVALNSQDGLEQIKKIRRHFGDRCIVGAGTAIHVELVKAAVDAGAQFFLTPGTPPDVFEYCAKNDLMLLPGVFTPGDVAVSLEYGYKTMKLFPAQCVPRGYVKALKGPFDDTNYIAIGGVRPDNIHVFLEEGYTGVGLASSLMPKEIIQEENWDAGSAYIRNYLKKAEEWRKK